MFKGLAHSSAIVVMNFFLNGKLLTCYKDCVKIWNLNIVKLTSKDKLIKRSSMILNKDNRMSTFLNTEHIVNLDLAAMDINVYEDIIVIGTTQGMLQCYEINDNLKQNFEFQAHSSSINAVKFTIFYTKLISASKDHWNLLITVCYMKSISRIKK